MYLLAKNRGIVSKLLYLNKRHKSTSFLLEGRSLSAHISTPLYCAIHKNFRSKERLLFTSRSDKQSVKMTSTAKNTSKNTRTYASAVKNVAEKSIFSTLAKCQLKSPRNMPHARIPNTNEQHSFFIDLKSTDASEEEVLAALTLDGIVGAHSRDDLWVVELICESDAVVEAAMNTVFTIEGKKPVEAIWP